MRFDLWEHCIIFSQRGKYFAKLRHVCRVHAFCGRVESGTRQMHCVNFGIQRETQTVSFLHHLEHDRREPGALLLLWRASAFRNLHFLDCKLLNYTGSCPLKSVCMRKLKLAHSEWRRPLSNLWLWAMGDFVFWKRVHQLQYVSPCWQSPCLGFSELVVQEMQWKGDLSAQLHPEGAFPFLFCCPFLCLIFMGAMKNEQDRGQKVTQRFRGAAGHWS